MAAAPVVAVAEVEAEAPGEAATHLCLEGVRRPLREPLKCRGAPGKPPTRSKTRRGLETTIGRLLLTGRGGGGWVEIQYNRYTMQVVVSPVAGRLFWEGVGR